MYLCICRDIDFHIHYHTTYLYSCGKWATGVLLCGHSFKWFRISQLREKSYGLQPHQATKEKHWLVCYVQWLRLRENLKETVFFTWNMAGSCNVQINKPIHAYVYVLIWFHNIDKFLLCTTVYRLYISCIYIYIQVQCIHKQSQMITNAHIHIYSENHDN